jgi:SAM-dependent methyltransferase
VFLEESLWIREVLGDLEIPSGSRVLDVGSSTRHYRNVIQPYIDQNVFLPLRERGCVVFHLDVFEGEGVDIICNMANPEVDIIEHVGGQYDVVICASTLTEVMNRIFVAQRLAEVVREGGYLLVTVPFSYRSSGPEDLRLRLSVQELHTLFSSSVRRRLEVLASRVMRIDDKNKYRTYSVFHVMWRLRYWIKPFRWKVSCILYKVL